MHVRTDTNPSTIPAPSPRTVTNTAGTSWTLSFVSDFKPPHVIIHYEPDPRHAGPATGHTVLFKDTPQEREGYVFELAVVVKLKSDSSTLLDSSAHPSFIQCYKLLAHNCNQETLKYLQDHQNQISQRATGTRYGSEYVPADAAAFTRQKSDYKLKVASCIGYLLDADRLGHEKTNSLASWKESYLMCKNGKGITLAKGLHEAGWLSIYYNPDTVNSFDKDHGKWEEHPYSYSVAKKRRLYYDLKVHDLVINYRPTSVYWDGKAVAKVTPAVADKLNILKAVPFGFLNARGGTYTAIIISGSVYEVHWDKGPDEPEQVRLDNLRKKPPRFLAEDNKSFPLRRGFRCRYFVVILTTDAAIF